MCIRDRAPDKETYLYYSTQRPIDIGTYPNSYFNRPVHLDLYFTRQQVPGEAFQAWGAITLSLIHISGKSFAAKREIIIVFLAIPKDRIIIVDPMGEYVPLVRRLGNQAQIIEISPDSPCLLYTSFN